MDAHAENVFAGIGLAVILLLLWLRSVQAQKGRDDDLRQLRRQLERRDAGPATSAASDPTAQSHE